MANVLLLADGASSGACCRRFMGILLLSLHLLEDELTYTPMKAKQGGRVRGNPTLLRASSLLKHQNKKAFSGLSSAMETTACRQMKGR